MLRILELRSRLDWTDQDMRVDVDVVSDLVLDGLDVDMDVDDVVDVDMIFVIRDRSH